jgi:hypothetical protein
MLLYFYLIINFVIIPFKFLLINDDVTGAAPEARSLDPQEVVFHKQYCIPLQRNQGYIVYETSKKWFYSLLNNI